MVNDQLDVLVGYANDLVDFRNRFGGLMLSKAVIKIQLQEEL